MYYLKFNERLLKHHLKNKRRITLSLIVTFLITGGLGFVDEEASARDLRARNIGANILNPATDGPQITQSINKTDVVEIKDSQNGISHNKFIDFSVGSGNSVIFNNNGTQEAVVTKTGGIVTKNTGLKTEANAILTEVTGSSASSIAGTVEIAGKTADFILANENGITVNGGGFINTSGVTLTTGKPNVNGSNIDLAVDKGKVTIESGGVGTAGDYFNIVAKTIELKGQVAAFEGATDADLTLIAGKNDVRLAQGKAAELTNVRDNKNDGKEKYGIYASNLGAMYGKNIRLISTTQGLGVRHEGLVRAAGDFQIDSKGDIVVGGINADNGIKLKGEGNFETASGTYNVGNKEYNFTITANDGIELEVAGDITIGNEIISQGVISKGGAIKITGNSLKVLGNKKHNGSITSNGYLTINVKGDIEFQELLKPVLLTGDKNNVQLVVKVDEKTGAIKVINPQTGKEVPEGSYKWESGGVFGQKIDIKGNNFTNNTKLGSLGNYRENTTDITLDGTLTNNDSIVAAGDLNIAADRVINNKAQDKTGLIAGAKVEITAKNVENKGQLRQNTHTQGETTSIRDSIKVNVKDGTFTNTGIVSGYNVEILGENFTLENTDTGIIVSGDDQYPYGAGNITINATRVDNRGSIRTDGMGTKNQITITAETLNNIGYILATKGDIEVSTNKSLINDGEIIAKKQANKGGNVNINGSTGSISNSGGAKIGGENITITSDGRVINYGMISAMEKVLINVNNFINAGFNDAGQSLLEEYLRAFYALSSESLEDAKKMVADLEYQLNSATSTNRPAIQAKLDHMKKVVSDLTSLNDQLNRLNFGMVSGNNIEIITKGESGLENAGIIRGNESIKLNSNSSLKNSGVVEAGKTLELKAVGDINNTNRLYAGDKIDISGKSFTSEGTNDKLEKYALSKKEYEEALKTANVKSFEELETKITELEEQLQKATEKTKIEELSKQLKDLRETKIKLSNLRAKVSGAGVGNLESKNINIEAKDGGITTNGIIMTDEALTLKATGDIKNGGNISVGTNATVEGNSFISEIMTVGKKLVAKVQNAFESKSLKVQKDMELEAANAKFSQDLAVGGKADITLKNNSGNVILENGTRETTDEDTNDVNIKGDLTIKGGGLENNLTTAIGGSLSVDKENNTSGNFKNTGTLSVTKDTTVKTGTFDNSGSMITGGSLDVDASGKLTNSGIIQAIIKEQARNEKSVNIKSQGLENTGNMIFGGNTTINAGSGNITNTKTRDKGSIEVSGDLSIETTGDFTNSGKLQNTGELTLEAKDIKNEKDGVILNSGAEITATGDITNAGKVESTGDLTITGNKNLVNSGNIATTKNANIKIEQGNITNTGSIGAGQSKGEKEEVGNLDISTKKLENNDKGTIFGEKKVDIKVTEGFSNTTNAQIGGGEIYIDGKSSSLKEDFTNAGKVVSDGKLTIDLGNNNKNINIGDSGTIASQDTLTLITGGGISNAGKFQNIGSIDFQAGKDITNTGMLVSMGDIKLKGDNITNGNGTTGATIWSNQNVELNATKDIRNDVGSTIEAKQDINITAGQTLTNYGGSIKAGKNLKINVNKLVNESIVDTGKVEIIPGRDKENVAYTGKYKFFWGVTDKWTHVSIKVPTININGSIKNAGTIEANGNLDIEAKDTNNKSGKIRAGQDISIKGNLKNETVTGNISVEEILENIYIEAWWSENFKNTDHIMNSGFYFKGSFKEYLSTILNHTNDKNAIFMAVLEAIKTESTDKAGINLKEILDSAFNGMLTENKGSDITLDNYNPNAKKYIYLAGASADIIAGGKFTFEDGKLENLGGEYASNKEISVTIGEGKVQGTSSNLGVVVGDPNEITEANGVKQVHEVEIQKGEVTINGVTISGTGGTISSIAVAGTINPIIYIDIPVGDNGIFKPATPTPGQRVPYKYETNIDFIDLSKYYGSDYFFDKIGYDKNSTSTVIGDAYYEKELINKTIRESLGYAGEVTADYIKTMLDNAADSAGGLGLEIGKPLTPDQINALEKDIVWYVEMEVDGEVVLVPQVYFGKETRIKMAQGDTGGGAGSNIKTGGDISISGDSLTNVNGNISAGGNVNIDVTGDVINNATGGFQGGISAGGDASIKAGNNIEMVGGTVTAGGSVDLEAGGDITIESTLGYDEKGNQTVSNQAGVTAGKDINISAQGDTNITNGTIESTDKGDVSISGDTVNIKDQNLISSKTTVTGDGITSTVTNTASSKSDGSTIAGENVTIKSNKDTNIKGSDVVSGDKTNIEAGGDVNITDGQDYSHTTSNSSTSGFINGKLTIGNSNTEISTSTSKKSTVGGVGGVNITSKGGDVNIKGSDVIGGDKGVDISAKGNVSITDGQNKVETKSDSWQYDVISVTKGSSESKTTTSQGSNITSTGGININAGGDVKSVGSNIASTKDTNITAGGDVKFEAGKNTHEEKSNSFGFGIISAGANAGAGGASAGANWDINQGGSVSVVDGKASDQTINDMNKVGKSGKNYMDSLTNAQVTVGISTKNTSKNSTTWTEGKVQTGGDLNIKSGGTTDIGGADFTTGKDFNITAKDIDSTKYTDVNEETSNGFSLGVKVGNTTTSSIADAVNKGMQIAENAQAGQVNEGLTAAQVAGSVSNVIFGDLVANTSSVTGEFSYNDSKSKTTSENTTNIKSGGDINFKATEGDINLKGVEMEGNDISLDAKKDVNISSSQNTSDEHGFGVTASGGITASAGVGTIDGANAQLGFTGNVGFNKTDNSSTTNSGSSIKGNNITIKSGGDTNVKGSTVEGNDVSLDVGGNLNVETEKNKVDESRIDAWAGGDLSAGVASNTIVTGDAGLSAGGGQIYKKGDSISQQAGITAKNKIDVNVGKDVNLKGGVIGSETGDGSLNVGGNINVDDVHSDLNGGGAIVGANGGTKGGGILGEVGDVIDKEQTAKGTIGINKDNITVGGDVTVNGKTNSNDNRDNGPNLDGINTDMNNGVTIDKDVVKGGGTFSGTVSALPSKKGSKKHADSDAVDGPIIPKISDGDTPSKGNVTNKVPDLDLPDTPPKVELPKPSFPESGKVVVDGPSAPVQKSEVTDLPKPEVSVPTKTPDADTNVVVKTEPTPPVQKAEVTDTPKPSQTETVDPPVISNGGYTKDPTTGKWVATGGDKGPQGAITTNGPFGSKGSLEGFQKGADSLNKGNTSTGTNSGDTGVKTPPVTQGNYTKDPTTGKWVATGGDKGPQGAITTNGPFGSKGSLEGFQKGADSLNKN